MSFPRKCVLAAAIATFLLPLLSGCATAPAASASSDTEKMAAVAAAAATAVVNAPKPGPNAAPGTLSPATAAAAAAAAAVQAGQPRPFAEVIKEAKDTPGLFPVWQKDEKVWIEIAPDQFDKPFLFTANLSRGVGEQGVYGGMMLFNQIVVFKRIGNNVQLIAKNYEYTGGSNAPIAQGVKEGFTDSLLGATTVASQAHPERKTVLLDANALLLTDIPVGERFTLGIHQRNYTFDAKNSSFEALRNTPDQSSFVVSAHYANPKATMPPTPTPTPPPPNPFPPFTTLPDGRSLFLGYTYNFAKLGEPMAARRADPRVGHFQTQIWDFSSDAKFTAKTHYVNRWRLEKKDPSAALSEPKEPIVYWIDRTVPEKYRGIVRDGILEWNKAYERSDSRTRLSSSSRRPTRPSTPKMRGSTALVRFPHAGFASVHRHGSAHRRNLNAEIGIPELWSRNDRVFITERHHGMARVRRLQGLAGFDGRSCTFPTDALAEMQFGLDVLEARGDFGAGSPG